MHNRTDYLPTATGADLSATATAHMSATLATMAARPARRTPSLTYAERHSARPVGAAMVRYLQSTRVERLAGMRVARAHYASFRAGNGMARRASKLLTDPQSQPKTGKSATPTYTLMMTPARGAGLDMINLCPAASAGCMGACLSKAGRGDMSSVQYGRWLRTAYMIDSPDMFGWILAHEIFLALKRHGGTVALRLNCLSDIRWELAAPDMLRGFMALGVTFYDYTAWPPHMRGELAGYDLTYSAKETHSAEWIQSMAALGRRIAVPFALGKRDAMPTAWRGVPVVDGDTSDYRPDDPAGAIVGLRVKGRNGKADRSGFIRPAV